MELLIGKKDIIVVNFINKYLNHLNKKIFIIGENYSKYQAWIEGALQTAHETEKLITNVKIKNIKKIKSTKKSSKIKSIKKERKITMKELQNHDNNNDRQWIAINKNVYDITEWQYEHPGGKSIISQWSGKDATTAFKNVMSHQKNSEEIKKQMKLMKVGILQIIF